MPKGYSLSASHFWLNFLKKFILIFTLSNRGTSKCFWNRALHDHNAYPIGMVPFLKFCLVSKVEVGHSVLSAKSKSIQPKTIYMASFQTLKFVSFSIGIEFTWAVTFAALAILTKQRTKINNMFTNNQASHIKYI